MWHQLKQLEAGLIQGSAELCRLRPNKRLKAAPLLRASARAALTARSSGRQPSRAPTPTQAPEPGARLVTEFETDRLPVPGDSQWGGSKLGAAESLELWHPPGRRITSERDTGSRVVCSRPRHQLGGISLLRLAISSEVTCRTVHRTPVPDQSAHITAA